MDIVVRSPNWIGDCIMSLPALRALKAGRPGDNIILITKTYLKEVYKNIDEINKILTIPDKSDLKSLFKAAGELKRYNFRQGILFTNSFFSALLFRLAGIKKLTGYNKDLRGFLLEKKIKFPGKENKKHHVFFYLDLIEVFTGKKIEKKYADGLIIDAAEKSAVTRLLGSKFGIDFSKALIGISPSAAYGSAKQWLPGRFARLIRRFAEEKRDFEILLFGSGREREKISGITAEVGEENKDNIYNLSGQLTLREALTAISLCRVFISNDSGLMHVASSLKIPLVAIFGPTLPRQTAPLYTGAAVLHQPVDCSPCKHRDCPLDHRCMKAITVDEVYGTVNAALQKKMNRAQAGQRF
ncbi:MAG: lipopolysaccharide heptosyltransferase II [Candidatus Aminicenantes bacterium]|nr:lipopolysaccharide heptosyltransferase II [Candidatus Aminicenantes bacterium]